jgi:hypothetical protein
MTALEQKKKNESIGLRFQKILKDFFMVKKSLGIQLRFLQN